MSAAPELPPPPPSGEAETGTGTGTGDAVLVAIGNAPDAASAGRIAQALVAERLAACVNLLAPCRSVYRWEGAVEAADEVPLLIPTTADRWAALQARYAQLHPHRVPELLAWPASRGLPAYAAWVRASVQAGSGDADDPAPSG